MPNFLFIFMFFHIIAECPCPCFFRASYLSLINAYSRNLEFGLLALNYCETSILHVNLGVLIVSSGTGLRFAGTKNGDAQEILYNYAVYFLNEVRR